MEDNTMNCADSPNETENTESKYKVILPHDFTERMQKLLKEEYQDFLASYEKERKYGLRFNPLKAANKSKEIFLSQMPFELEPVPWTDEGFYYRQSAQPGKHAFHEAGAYYIQEPSAMAVVEVLAPKPGEQILDLCAAPGGKSTHIAGKMMGEGLLVSNEIIPGRAKILSQNIERMGIANAVVCNETPERLAESFPSYFDKILVDAPCSGEGMFRKDETAINEWSLENVKMCAGRQKMILENAASMLKSGGVLVYSTCTFSVEENEEMISSFLKEHEEFSIEKTELEGFFEPGKRAQIEAWTENPATDIEHTIRLWPHKIDGEGHFIARIKKAGERYENTVRIKTAETHSKIEARKKKEKAGTDGIKLCRNFLTDELGLSIAINEQFMKRGVFISFGEQIYLMPEHMISIKGLKVVRPGLHLGTVKRDRFEPSHALALYLSGNDVARYYEMNENETESYLHGDVFPCDSELKGWVLLATGGYSIGFGKAGNGQMKNHYPKGLRK